MSSIKKEMASGVLYTSIAKYSNIVVQIIVTAILSRLLTPDDYGVVAIAAVFIIFFNILSDIGIGPAVIQFKDLNQKDLNSIFSFTVYIGFVLSLLFFGSSWIVAYFYNNKCLIPVCQLLSLTILFNCINIVPLNIQYKNKNFKYVAIVSFVVNVITAIVSVFLAVWGFGVYSLVFQYISSSFVSFLFFFFKERLSFYYYFELTTLKKIYSFSVYQFLFNLINYFSRNLDKLLVGRYVGMAELGQYEKSYRLMMLPLSNITFVVTPVLQPIFSGFQNDLFDMAEKYKKLFQFLCFIGFPLSILLFFVSKELILIFYGGQWNDAVFPFKVMSLTVGLQILNGTTGSIYQSANATKQLFKVGCVTAFLMVSSFLIAIIGWKTIDSVAIAFSIAQLLNSIQVYYTLFRTLNYPLGNIIKVMLYPIMVSAIIGCILFLISILCSDVPLMLSLCVKCIVAFGAWFVFVNYAGPYKGLIAIQLYRIKDKILGKLPILTSCV